MSLNNLFQRLREKFGGFSPAKSEPELSEDGLVRASAGWQPKEARRRVEIMVTGDPSRVGVIADTMDAFQKKMFAGSAQPDNLEFRITGFLDNCIHRSKWSRKPFKAAAQARRWHCEQSQTRFTDAFANSSGEMINDLVIIGDRFDDKVEDALRQVEHLKEQGVHIHCFHSGKDLSSRAIYEKLATETGGVFMQLEHQSSITEVMPVLMAHLNSKESLLALDPKDQEAQKLMRLLTPDAPNDPETR